MPEFFAPALAILGVVQSLLRYEMSLLASLPGVLGMGLQKMAHIAPSRSGRIRHWIEIRKRHRQSCLRHIRWQTLTLRA